MARGVIGSPVEGGGVEHVVGYIDPATGAMIDANAEGASAVPGAIPVWYSDTIGPALALPEYPEFPDYSESTAEVLNAQLAYGPQFAASEFEEQATYLPLQAQLAQDMAEQYQPQQLALQLALTEEFLPQFAAIDQAIMEAERQGDFDTVLELSAMLPEIRAAAQAPEVAAMRTQLGTSLSDQLAMGTQLTPKQQRQVEQELRASEASRGIELGQGSANREAVAKAIEGQDLLNQRQASAQSFLAQEDAATADPFLAALGRPSTSLSAGTAQQAGGLALPTTAGQTPDSSAFLNTALGVNQQGSSNAMNSANYQMAVTQYQTALDLALSNPNL